MAKTHLTLEDLHPTMAEAKENRYIEGARAKLARLDKDKRAKQAQASAQRRAFLILLAVDIALIVYDLSLL